MYGYENVDEQVAVLIGFDPSKKPMIQPFKIRWHNKDYVITKVAHYYRYKAGRAIMHVVTVTDGTNFFELQCESETLVWKLNRVGDNETH